MAKELRPTSSKVLSAIFSIIGQNGLSEKKIIDMFAGTGNFGISSIKRGATEVSFLEINYKRCTEISKKLKKLQDSGKFHVIRGDIPKTITKITHKADFIFIDPPYSHILFEKIMKSLLENNILISTSIIIIEHSNKVTLPDSYPGLILRSRKRYGDSALTLFQSDKKYIS